MFAEEIDHHLRELEEPKRSTLEHLRRAILRLDDLEGLTASKGALRSPLDTPPSDTLVAKLIAARCAEIHVPQ